MGASEIVVSSFEMYASTHSILVDSDLSLLTVTIEGLSSATYVSLDRPDGKQIFTEGEKNKIKHKKYFFCD